MLIKYKCSMCDHEEKIYYRDGVIPDRQEECEECGKVADIVEAGDDG